MKNLKRLFFAVVFCAVIASCDKEVDHTPELFPVEQDVFSKDRLTLNYSGEPLWGKVVQFTPDAEDPSKALLLLSGEDWGSGMPTSGVIPGMKTTELHADLVQSHDAVTFNGTEEVEGNAIVFEGCINADGMQLDMTVKVPGNQLLGTYKVQSAEGISPVIVKWDTAKVPVAGIKWDVNTILSLVMSSVKIDQVTIPEKLQQSVHELRFFDDGNVQLQYSKKDEAQENHVALEKTDSPLNIAFYSDVTPSDFRLYLNPFGISKIRQENQAAGKVAAQQGMTKGVDLGELIATMKPLLFGKLEEGILLSTRNNPEGDMTVYLDERVVLPLMQAVKPVFEDPGMIDLILGIIAENSPQGVSPILNKVLEPLLRSLPNLIDSTTKIELGIRVVEVK